ncbi:MAG: 2-(1,2-epoxy-1,2-dihydrophenyl)acetyl-CoA isomerase [Caldilineae bacterium]|nr:MAG: 2-(1,2-epoxy-1,2-dihydrophenyl)acetyl-CoA isomerase [Caldilineae bacterium]
MSDPLLFDVSGGIATVTLNRPDKLNALTTSITGAFLDILKTCARDDSIRCVVLTGSGRGFCAGQDLEEFMSVQGEWSVSDHLRRGYNRIISGLWNLEKPVIGKINGVAAGAGLGLALATDLRIASDQAAFTAAFIGIGLVPDSGVSWFLPRLVGQATAFELLVSGEKVNADRALQLGLVNRVVPHDALDAAVAELAQHLAAGPTRGIGLTKRVLHKTASLSLAEALEYEALVQDIAVNTNDHREGVAAFLQKRQPQFQGR